MPKFDKNTLEQILDRIIEGLKPENVNREYSYYTSLYPKDVTEADIARTVRSSHKLHAQMETIVRNIISLIDSGQVSSMWIDEEEQAGCLLSYSLAIFDKKYCELFAESLLHQDLEHEVNQNSYINKLIKKWGACSETAKILKALRENPGQSGDSLINYFLEEYEEFSEYVDASDDNDERTIYIVPNAESRIIINRKDYADHIGKFNTKQLINQIRETPSSDKVVKCETGGNPQWFNNRAIADLLDACYDLCGFNEREKQVFELCVNNITQEDILYITAVHGVIGINRVNGFMVLDLFYQGKGRYVLSVLASGADLEKWDVPEEFITYTKQLYDEFKVAKKKK